MNGVEDLIRPGEADRERYRKKVEELLKEHAEEVFSHEDVITAPDGTVVRIRIPDIHEPRFRYADEGGEPSEGVGSGEGKPGDVIGWRPAPSRSREGGSEGTADGWLEVLVPLEEAARWVFDRLGLPPVDKRKRGDEDTVEDALTARGRRGVILDRKRTLLAHRKRELALGHQEPWHTDDLVWRRWHEKRQPSFQAVLALVRDISGSITEEQTRAIRIAAFWAVQWLRMNYPRVQVRFVVHDTKAWEVDERTFFDEVPQVGGGTLISTGLEEAERILDAEHPEVAWNRYLLFFTDGLDWPEDVPRAIDALQRLVGKLELVGWAQVLEANLMYTEGATLFDKLPLDLAGNQKLRGGYLDQRVIADWLRVVFGDQGVKAAEA